VAEKFGPPNPSQATVAKASAVLFSRKLLECVRVLAPLLLLTTPHEADKPAPAETYSPITKK
jgi:hypothetical protein